MIYVAEGQEDKMSILSNSGGSAGFEVKYYACFYFLYAFFVILYLYFSWMLHNIAIDFDVANCFINLIYGTRSLWVAWGGRWSWQPTQDSWGACSAMGPQERRPPTMPPLLLRLSSTSQHACLPSQSRACCRRSVSTLGQPLEKSL